MWAAAVGPVPVLASVVSGRGLAFRTRSRMGRRSGSRLALRALPHVGTLGRFGARRLHRVPESCS
jgi:hypothetical protein